MHMGFAHYIHISKISTLGVKYMLETRQRLAVWLIEVPEYGLKILDTLQHGRVASCWLPIHYLILTCLLSIMFTTAL
jgi:hypothetical protein